MDVKPYVINAEYNLAYEHNTQQILIPPNSLV